MSTRGASGADGAGKGHGRCGKAPLPRRCPYSGTWLCQQAGRRTRRTLAALAPARHATRHPACEDPLGVTSIVRALGLEPACYDRLLDFFYSPALDPDKLTRAWRALVFRLNPGLLRVNGKPVLAGDGIKIPKAGRKMPGGQLRSRRNGSGWGRKSRKRSN